MVTPSVFYNVIHTVMTSLDRKGLVSDLRRVLQLPSQYVRFYPELDCDWLESSHVMLWAASDWTIGCLYLENSGASSTVLP